MSLKPSFLFYSGTFLSSVGTVCLNICLAAFMIKSGFDLLSVGLILGLQRFVPVTVNTFIGQYTDILPPRLTIILSEFTGAVASIGIFLAWRQGHDGYALLLATCVLRACIVSFQSGSRNKISKILSDGSYESTSKNAIWFNKATQGASVFAGLISWPIIQYGRFETAIIVDALTFILNGIGLLMISISAANSIGPVSFRINVTKKFVDLYRLNPRAAFLDLLLAISMMGTASFVTRLAGLDQSWNPIFLGAYGLAIWLGGVLEHSAFGKNKYRTFWITLAIGFALMGIFPESGWLTFGACIVCYTSYAVLLHRISSYIQMDTPVELLGSVSAARMTQMVLVLSAGEMLVGAWEKRLPMLYEGLWRSVFCLIVIIGLIFLFPAKEKAHHGRPSL